MAPSCDSPCVNQRAFRVAVHGVGATRGERASGEGEAPAEPSAIGNLVFSKRLALPLSIRERLLFRLVCTIFLTLTASVSPVAGQTAPQQEAPAVVDLDNEYSIEWESYGELHYNNYQGGDKTDQLDFHRFILELEYHLDASTKKRQYVFEHE